MKNIARKKEIHFYGTTVKNKNENIFYNHEYNKISPSEIITCMSENLSTEAAIHQLKCDAIRSNYSYDINNKEISIDNEVSEIRLKERIMGALLNFIQEKNIPEQAKKQIQSLALCATQKGIIATLSELGIPLVGTGEQSYKISVISNNPEDMRIFVHSEYNLTLSKEKKNNYLSEGITCCDVELDSKFIIEKNGNLTCLSYVIRGMEYTPR